MLIILISPRTREGPHGDFLPNPIYIIVPISYYNVNRYAAGRDSLIGDINWYPIDHGTQHLNLIPKLIDKENEMTDKKLKAVNVILPQSEYGILKELADEDERPLAHYVKRLMEDFMKDPDRINLKGKYKKIKRSEEEKKKVALRLDPDFKDSFFAIAESKDIMGVSLIRLLIQERAGKDLPHYLVK